MYNNPTIITHLKLPLIFLGIILLFSSCNPTKYVKPNELFLKKTKVKVDTRKINQDQIETIIKQKPNRKILGLFRFHLGVNNLFKEESENKIKLNVGELPVIYDSLLTEKSVTQLKIYVNNKGYFDNQVSYKTKIHKNKIKIEYNITAGEAYTIKKTDYIVEDEAMKKNQLFLLKTILKLHPGSVFDIDVLDAERERIKTELKNQGYYYFTKEYIKYKVDTAVGDKQVAVYLYIKKQKIEDQINDTIIEANHSKYNINNVNVYLSKNFKDKDKEDFDTLSFKNIMVRFDTSNGNKLKYRPRMLNHAISLKKGELYLLDNQQYTYKHLSELRLFKNISVSYEDIGNNKLNTNLFLTPSLTKSFSIEGIGTNSGGNLGVEGNLIYQNKNLFHGGEHLTAKLNGGLEIQQLINQEQEEETNFLGVFNTIEFGPELNLEFPRFLLPINLEKFSIRANPKTNLNLLLNFQKRPEYTRNLTQFTFGYFWKESKYKKHYVTPINVSVIDLEPTTEFQEKLDQENNPFILNSYKDHFINSTTYSFIFNNQSINKSRDFIYFKFNAEFAGNIQYYFSQLTNKPFDDPETESYKVFNIRYAQFIKTDLDLRFYSQSKSTSFVQRINIGVGVPYKNLNVLPFEKSYYGGGANGIRAWQARSLGPGSLADSLTINSLNQIGELKIEGNAEYRFDLTKLVEGAVFVDAGNIWILTEDENRPKAEFKPEKFWRDIAIGVGVGLRLDFNFFLIRFDLASKLKDPASSTPEKFDLIWNKPTLNLGIGYPF